MDCINDTDNSVASPAGTVSVSDSNPKLTRPSPPSPSSPSPKRSRRSMDKRVVSIPIQEVDGSRAKGVSECAPPSDSWAWRKYGQKPIKGSPYPRGYYRCSSAKGCPARKQVERSRVDPTMLVVTYSSEHNHSYPVPKTHHSSKQHAHGQHAQAAVKEELSEPEPIARNSPESVTEPDESKFSDLIGEEYFWDVGSTSSTSPESDTMLYGPIFVGSTGLAFENEKFCEFNDEDDALFAGLGELPEFSTVFRRYIQLAVHE